MKIRKDIVKKAERDRACVVSEQVDVPKWQKTGLLVDNIEVRT